MYLQRNTVNNIKVSSQAHSDDRKARGFVITTEPLGFVLRKEVNDSILRVKIRIYGLPILTGRVCIHVYHNVELLYTIILENGFAVSKFTL